MNLNSGVSWSNNKINQETEGDFIEVSGNFRDSALCNYYQFLQ